jgi:hypothetical protein
VADAHAVAVAPEGGEPIDRDDRDPGDDDADERGPDQVRQREGDDAPFEKSQIGSESEI